jgi:tRNA(adenine34) deaminase
MPTEQNCPFTKLFPSQLERNASFYMQHAYNQSINGWNADEVPIGAVIVFKDEIIASAYNQTRQQKDPSAHAEMIAITQAAKFVGDWRLNECQLYVTKEPCPMCAGATVISRMGEVHFAFTDPKMGGLGGSTSLHELPHSNHKPKVFKGTLELECKSLIQKFFQLKRQVNT